MKFTRRKVSRNIANVNEINGKRLGQGSWEEPVLLLSEPFLPLAAEIQTNLLREDIRPKKKRS